MKTNVNLLQIEDVITFLGNFHMQKIDTEVTFNPSSFLLEFVGVESRTHYKGSIIGSLSAEQISIAFLIFVLVPGQPGKFQVGKVTDTSVELTWEPAYSKEPVKAYELIYKSPDLGVQVRAFSIRALRIFRFQWYWYQLLK